MKLSVLVPVFNEENTVQKALKALSDVDFPCEVEIIVVNDGSTDRTADKLSSSEAPGLMIHSHPKNLGKGAAIKTAARLATGDHLVIYDADAEYDAHELPALLAPVIAGEAQVVYGSRTFKSHTSYSFWYVMGNKAVTFAASFLFNAWITDLETCYKLMPRDLFNALDIRSKGFGMEAEVTAKLLKAGYRPYEVPISYKARTRLEGKKLTWRDGVNALWILLKVRLSPTRLPRPR